MTVVLLLLQTNAEKEKKKKKTLENLVMLDAKGFYDDFMSDLFYDVTSRQGLTREV